MDFTTDTSLVTRVWASFSYDDVFSEVDFESTDEPVIENFDARLSAAYDTFARAIEAEFPNATDIMVESTGWESAWAQFSPRAETEDGTPYEHFFDWLNEVCQTLSN